MGTKKERELEILESFRNHYPDFPKGHIVASESPDFILSCGAKRKTGIELMRLHRKSVEEDLFSYENISLCLHQKEEKLRLYRKKKLQKYWLILFVQEDVRLPSYNLSNKLLVWEFRSDYDKIFLFIPTHAGLFELKTS